jgi:hypothetical protein
MSMKDVVKAANAGDGSHAKPAVRPSEATRRVAEIPSMSLVKKITNTGKGHRR